MIRTRFCVRLCGIGLLLLLTPLIAPGQMGGAAGGTGEPGHRAQVAPASRLPSSGGVAVAATAEGAVPRPLARPRAKVIQYTASSGLGSATSIPSNANYMANPRHLLLARSAELYATQYGAQNVIPQSGGPKGNSPISTSRPRHDNDDDPTAEGCRLRRTARSEPRLSTRSPIRFRSSAQCRRPAHSGSRDDQNSTRLAGKGNFRPSKRYDRADRDGEFRITIASSEAAWRASPGDRSVRHAE